MGFVVEDKDTQLYLPKVEFGFMKSGFLRADLFGFTSVSGSRALGSSKNSASDNKQSMCAAGKGSMYKWSGGHAGHFMASPNIS
jgi:hypothetical protein